MLDFVFLFQKFFLDNYKYFPVENNHLKKSLMFLGNTFAFDFYLVGLIFML